MGEKLMGVAPPGAAPISYKVLCRNDSTLLNKHKSEILHHLLLKMIKQITR